MITATAPIHDDLEALGGDSQYLTFRLGEQEYAIGILKVQEIRVWDRVTPIPNSPRHVKGVLNLRGTIVPIIDLRLRFGLDESEYNELTVIVVVNVRGRLAGLVVDAVQDVIDVPPDRHCAAPDYEGREGREFILGLAQKDEQLLVLLDIDKLVNPEAIIGATPEALGS
ncbi:MAG TPA: chemotaxis protein CheW [Acidiferrobacterales bacterium]|jgi:purine-binding chemotaxis protein CheW